MTKKEKILNKISQLYYQKNYNELITKRAKLVVLNSVIDILTIAQES